MPVNPLSPPASPAARRIPVKFVTISYVLDGEREGTVLDVVVSNPPALFDAQPIFARLLADALGVERARDVLVGIDGDGRRQ